MKKLAIVSSYSESCGNAAFTKVLHDSIEQYTELGVEVVELKLKLLQSIQHQVRKRGDNHIKQICEQLKNFDAVNIQLEAGLFGTLPRDIERRARRLMRANPNTSVTFHSPRLISDTSEMRAGIKAILGLKLIAGFKQLLRSAGGNIHVRLNHRLLKAAIANRCRLIVHTGRAKELIEAFYSYTNVDLHPLQIVPEGFVPNRVVLLKIIRELGLAGDPKIAVKSSTEGEVVSEKSTCAFHEDFFIGMFGYLSAYKGHLDALHALRYLPTNFKLLIFGRQHPQTLKTDGLADKYVAELRDTVAKDKRLRKRVFFLGELPDQEFMNVAGSVDVAWLPYYENGQDGSGIASICVDACPRVLCSTSFAFDELLKLVEYKNVMRFDIGNYVELAQKTCMILTRELPAHPFGNKQKFNLISQACVYVK